MIHCFQAERNADTTIVSCADLILTWILQLFDRFCVCRVKIVAKLLKIFVSITTNFLITVYVWVKRSEIICSVLELKKTIRISVQIQVSVCAI